MATFIISCKDSDKNIEEKKTNDNFNEKICSSVGESISLTECEEFHPSGNIKRKGKYLDGEAIGKHEYYNDKGKPYLIADYFPMQYPESEPNQIVYLSEQGDTVYDESYYFDLVYDKKVKQYDTFNAEFKLKTPNRIDDSHKKGAALYLTKNDTLSVLVDTSTTYNLKYTDTTNKLGWNPFEGFLLETVLKGDSIYERKYYFTRSFFVTDSI